MFAHAYWVLSWQGCHAFLGSSIIANADAKETRGVGDDWCINQAHFVSAGVRDDDGLTVGRPSDWPGIGGATTGAIQQHKTQDLETFQVQDAQSAAIHAPQLDCGGGQPIHGPDMCDGCEAAIRRNSDTVKETRAQG